MLLNLIQKIAVDFVYTLTSAVLQMSQQLDEYIIAYQKLTKH
ncbi:Spo0E family sporulation regulatory protein-aspartic acid phosphatase [Brevibacterium sp. JNUCC-42]|nr:Spo0E family sporulation regulatory protein-aspartic acid phosphatase [Brevibacterium sp. JNUCC-42]